MKKGNSVVKRALACLLVVIMTLTEAPLSGFVGLELPKWSEMFATKASAASEGYYTYSVSNGEVTITDCDTSISGDVVIPDTLGGHPVTRIGYRAFEDCTNLTSITIPNSVTSIGSEAFYYCTGLKSIVIPDSVTKIGNEAFYNCKSLTSITIPSSVTWIGGGAFGYCTSLTSITIPSSVESIGNGAFSWCESLTSITIPNSVTSIGYNTFYNCTSLTSITIPSSVTSIEYDAFSNCTSLTSITIPSSVTSIGNLAFKNCTSLTSINVDSANSKYASINGVLFNKSKTELICYPAGNSATLYEIPSSVMSIGDYAFYSCKNLTSITIPNSVKSIGRYAFSHCTSLTSITIPNSVTSIEYGAFYYCTSLTSITISNSVTSIENNAFSDCTCLKNITLPDSLTSIGGSAFYNTAWYNSQPDGDVYIGKLYYKHKGDMQDNTSIKINDGTKAIAEQAFSHCTSLTSVTIPNSVTNIGGGAFSNCTGLTSITIPNSVTSIGDRAFEDCTHLTQINWNAENIDDFKINNEVFHNAGTSGTGINLIFGDSVKRIPAYMFFHNRTYNYDIVKIKSVTIGCNVKSIGERAFDDCNEFTSVYIYDLASWCTIAFGSATSNPLIHAKELYINGNLTTNITIPSSVTSIGDYAFYSCKNLTSITIPNSVTNIGSGVFGDCTGLTSITIPNSVTSIGNSAFSGCTKLTSVTIPNSVTNIGGGAFRNCTGLTRINWNAESVSDFDYDDDVFFKAGTEGDGIEVIFGDNVKSIPTYAFYADYYYSIYNGYIHPSANIKSVTIGKSVTSIGDCAFKYCTGLESVTMSDSVTSIGKDSFYNTKWLNSQPNGDVYVGKVYYKYKGSMPSNTSITIKDGTKAIAEYAFDSCNGLTSITIPKSVISIGAYAFYNCRYIANVYISDLSAWCAIEFENWSSNPARQVNLYINGNLATNITIPDSVTSIGNYAFYECESLTSIAIPSSVTRIGDEAFSYCASLTSITIPNSVTSIGEGAFFYCESLKSITIPKGITNVGGRAFTCTPWYENTQPDGDVYIGKVYYEYKGSMPENTSISIKNGTKNISSYAFYSSASLTSITIPNSVTSIGDYAFCSCKNLTSITIPNSVMSIGKDAFCGCTSLTSITIPNSVTSIENSAFRNCTSLTSITIPSSVTRIEEGTFHTCESLTSITIPSSVKSIGRYAFSHCTNLTSITIPNSVTSIGGGTFWVCESLKDVYYTGSKSDWNKIYIKTENRDTLKNATIHYNSSPVIQNYINKNQYVILVVDSAGNPIVDAEVSWNSTKKATNKDGVASFDKLTVGQPTITVTKNGYRSYDNKNINYEKSDKGYEIITLYTEKESKLKLKSAKYINAGIKTDILTGTKSISADTANCWDLDDGKFSLSVQAIDPKEAVRYELWQGSKKIITSTYGGFTDISVDWFSVGGDVKIKAYDKNNLCVTTPINLKITDKSAVNKDRLVGIKGNKITISIADEDIPFVGGTDITFEIPEMPIEVYVEGDKWHVGINTKLAEYSSKRESATTDSEKQETKNSLEKYVSDLKESMATLKKYSGKNISKSTSSQIRKLMKEDKSLNVPVAGKVKVKFIGYGEGSFNKNDRTIKVSLCLSVDVSVNKTWQTYVYFVPVVVDLGASWKTGLSATADFDASTGTLSGDVKLDTSIGVDVFGGIGLGKVTGVGATGSAEVGLAIQLLSTDSSNGLDSVDLTGKLGVKAYFCAYEKSKIFAQHTWQLYTKTKGAKAKLKSARAETTDLYQTDDYEVSDISYLSGQSDWLGEKKTSIRKAKAVTASETFKPMLTDTYRNSQPVTATNGTDAVMAYIGAGEGRDEYNIPTLMYSLYDSESDTWSAPVKLDKNNTADQTPYLYSDGNDIYLVYSDSERIFDSSDDISSCAANQSIAVSKFNRETKTFSDPVKIAFSNGKFLSVPEVSIVNGTPIVIWQSNSDTDIFGQNTTNEILYSTFDGTDWSNARSVKTGLNSIVGQSVGELNGKAVIAYIIDNDNDLNTIEDRALYLTDLGGNSKKITEGILSNPDFVVLPGSENKSLIAYADGNIAVYDGETLGKLCSESPAKLTDKYAVLSDRILFLGATKESSNIFALIYDEETDTWSDSIQITGQSNYIDNFSPFEIGGNRVIPMIRKDVTISDEAIEDVSELCWICSYEKTDLTVTDVSYESEKVVPNENLPLAIDLTNNGDSKIESVRVTVCDSDGNLKASQDVDISLSPSETDRITVNLPMESEISLEKYTVTVEPKEKNDIKKSDNSYETTVGYTDLSVTTDEVRIGNSSYIIATIKNESYVPTDGMIEIFNSTSETAVKNNALSTLAYGETMTAMIPVDENLVGSDTGRITVKVTPNADEINDGNNVSDNSIDLSDRVIPQSIELNTSSVSLESGKSEKLIATVLPQDAENKTVIWQSSDETVAAVSQDGVVTAISSGTAEITATTVEGGYIASAAVEVKNTVCTHENMTETIEKEATCVDDGIKRFSCENCDYSYTEAIPATGHTAGEWIIDKASDCTTGGTKHRICSVCATTIDTAEIPIKAHQYNSVVTEPTCTAEGYTTHTCSVCGNTYTDSTVAALGHSFTNYISNNDATCTADGTKTAKCDRCDATDTAADTGSKLAHTVKTVTTKATTSMDGKIVTACTVCKTVSKTVMIPKVSYFKLSATAYSYDGKVKTPTVTVKDSKGKTLRNGTDYTLVYASGRKNIGRYAIKVTLKGNYSGSKTLYFDIIPAQITKLKATQTTNSITLSWSKVAGSNMRYYVFTYNPGTKKYKSLGYTTGASYTVKKLSSGTTYYFAVQAYNTTAKRWGKVSPVLTTATKPGTPTLKAVAGTRKATLSWNKQNGAIGYLLYMATSKNGKYTKIATLKGSTKVSYTKTGLTKGKTYYFKVIAYKTVGSTNIYGANSSVKYVKIK